MQQTILVYVDIATKMGVNRESFYRSLSQKGKARFSTLVQSLTLASQASNSLVVAKISGTTCFFQ